MPKTNPFDQHFSSYDRWFDTHQAIYNAELQAIAAFIPAKASGLEIGVGTGRFANPLGVNFGIEPSSPMAAIASKRGVQVINGIAESLPIQDQIFDYTVMVTSVCFMDNVNKAFDEAHRVLKCSGRAIVAIINRESTLGNAYCQKKAESLFYKEACFFSVPEITEIMRLTGFCDFRHRQVHIDDLSETKEKIAVTEGFENGGVVVVCGRKK